MLRHGRKTTSPFCTEGRPPNSLMNICSDSSHVFLNHTHILCNTLKNKQKNKDKSLEYHHHVVAVILVEERKW